VIIWLNGAFGVGKSTVAEEMNRRLKESFIYDPEQAGYFLWDNFPEEMKRKGNFQHIPLWREINYCVLKHINDHYSGVVIVPMTIYIRQYYDEIAGRLLRYGVSISPFILCASRQTIRNRLVVGRSDAEDGWGARHIDRCLDAFETDIPGDKIITDDKSVEEVAEENSDR